MVDLPPGFRVVQPNGANAPAAATPPAIPAGFRIAGPANPYLADLPVPGTIPDPTQAPGYGEWEKPGAIVPVQFQKGTGAMRPAVPQLVTDAIGAIQAPGKAYNGEYGQSEVDPATGEVSPFDPRMMDDATNLASMVTPVTPGARVAAPAAKAAVTTADDLKAEASALYDVANESGVTFPGTAVKGLVDDVTSKVMTEGIDPTLHPRATAALKRLNDVSSSGMTIREVQTMRRILAAAGKDPMNPDEGRIAGMMVDALDDFTAAASPELTQARGVYSRAKKGQLLEETMQKARDMAGANYSSSGFENALRQQFKNLLTSKTALRGFSAEEKEAIRNVAMGGPIENALRYLGRMAPTGNISAASVLGVPTMMGAAGGNAGLGALAGIGLAGVGMGARSAATNMTLKNARLAAAMAMDGAPAKGGMPTPFLESLMPKANTTLIEQNIPSPLMQLAAPNFRLST